MTDLKICRANNYQEDECRAVAEDLLGQLVNKYGGGFTADGDNYKYKNMGVTALVEPQAGELNISIKLGMMTRSLAPTLEKEINRVLDEQIG